MIKDAVFMHAITYLFWELHNIPVASKGFGFGVVCICHSKTRRDRANMANKCQEFRIGLRAGANCRSDEKKVVYVELVQTMLSI